MKIRGYGSEVSVMPIDDRWVYAETVYTYVDGARKGPVYLTPRGARKLAAALVRLAGKIERTSRDP